MGQEVCRTVLARPGLDLVAVVDPGHAGVDLGRLIGADAGGMAVAGALGVLTDTGTEVIVDFTRVDAARTTLAFCAATGIHAVVGTTGFSEDDIAQLRGLFAGPEAGAPNCVVAPNFAIGAVLLMRFAELAAPFFDGVEIIELHHDGKLDAPSGTAMRTAERIAAGRAAAGADRFPPDRTATSVVDGARGGEGPGGVRLHSVRLPGLVAHEEVIFGGIGQSLTLRHDSYDRSSFMDGVMMAVEGVANRPGLTLGLEPLLGL
jgi:4-hydroxy-tetrahydrodipicolinate reductase